MTLDDFLKREFPNLQFSHYQVTSPPTIQYNCIAWAAGQSNKWWWPIQGYWPGQGRRDESPKAFVEAFAHFGYSSCEDGAFESGYEKVAIYVGTNGIVTHMSRQLPDGRWTSKLGKGVDIAHTLEGISGDKYGEAVKFLKRANLSSPS